MRGQAGAWQGVRAAEHPRRCGPGTGVAVTQAGGGRGNLNTLTLPPPDIPHAAASFLSLPVAHSFFTVALTPGPATLSLAAPRAMTAVEARTA